MRWSPVLIASMVLTPTLHAAGKDLTFERDIWPLFNNHCLACHGGVHQRNDLDLRTIDGVLKGSKSGKAIVPGKPDESLLWQKVHADQMPKTDNKVAAGNKAILRAWIAAGARSSRDEKKEPRVAPKVARNARHVAERIDREIRTRLDEQKIPPSPLADDAEYLRRIYLDVTGNIPPLDAVVGFLDRKDPNRRERVIDELLADTAYGKHFATEWTNLFLLNTVNQRPPHPGEFIAWMGDAISQGRPWDKIVRDMLTADGFLKDRPEGMFFYYNSDMNGQIEAKIVVANTAQHFLGIQLQCAECHHHPFSDWKQTEFWGLAAFFSTTTRTETVENKFEKGIQERQLNPKRRPAAPPKELAINIPNNGEARNSGMRVKASFLGGEPASLDLSGSYRPAFAHWLTGQRLFAQAYVNRTWAHFFGRGFVNPLNDMHDGNPASHPELLEDLTDEFIASGYDAKHLIRCICLSETYQRTSKPLPGNKEDRSHFSHMAVKVMTPEMLHDALCRALETADLTPPLEPGKKAKALPKGAKPPDPRDGFVAFVRGLAANEDPTELTHGVPQALRLLNQSTFSQGGRLVERVLSKTSEPKQVVESLFLATLARRPRAEEEREFLAFLGRQSTLQDGANRALWVLINSGEFVVNH
jgi:hypothetical protein